MVENSKHFSSLSDRFPGYNICGSTVPVNHIDVRGHGLLLPPYIDFYHINHLPWASFITKPPSCPNSGAGLANLYEINRTGMIYGAQNTHCVLLPPYGVGDLGQYYPDSKVHGAYMGPTGPRWAPCWPYDPCYLGSFVMGLLPESNKLMPEPVMTYGQKDTQKHIPMIYLLKLE